MTVRIGAGPLGWFEDDFSTFRNDIVREAHLVALSRARFDGLSLSPATPREVAAVHAALTRFGLRFVAPTHRIALTKRTAEDVFGELQPHLRAARALGATEVTVSDSADAVMAEADWERFCERLTALAKACMDLGLRLVYRPAAGKIASDATAIDRLMAATGSSVGLMLDEAIFHDKTIGIARRHAARIAIVAVASDPDAVLAALPAFAGWTMIDEHAGHAPERIRHIHVVADHAMAA